jgi:hypothetical protein
LRENSPEWLEVARAKYQKETALQKAFPTSRSPRKLLSCRSLFLQVRTPRCLSVPAS